MQANVFMGTLSLGTIVKNKTNHKTTCLHGDYSVMVDTGIKSTSKSIQNKYFHFKELWIKRK